MTGKKQSIIVRNLSRIFVLFLFVFLTLSVSANAQQEEKEVEIDGDIIEFVTGKNEVVAKGNVIIEYGSLKLYCDKVRFLQSENVAFADGNVRLVRDGTEVTGDKIKFDFTTMQGDFNNARIMAYPYFGGGQKVSMIDDDKIVMKDAFVTTSDYDKPEYRIASKRIEVYPGNKLVAHHIKGIFGNVPLVYLPRFSHKLTDTKPRFQFTPGFDSDWGAFLLTEYRYYLKDNVEGALHVDYREKLDLGFGTDLTYRTDDFGSGLLDLYFTHERKISSDHPWEDKPSPTKERDRYKIEWRHNWQVDQRTNAIWQYYKLSDRNFLKDFFENESEDDQNPNTFFLLTRAMPKGTFSLRSDIRVNRFTSALERLPEVEYDLPSAQIFDTGLYFRGNTAFSNLVKKTASPSDNHRKTRRGDASYEVSYPKKVGIFELRPFIGGRNTYYSETKNRDDYDSIRGIFRSGTSLSTKFYRVFDVEVDKWGLKVDRLRHIITPTVNYEYTTEPTITSDQLDQFDAVDAIEREHNINFTLENKLQTKRNGENVDLLRAIVGTNYRLKEDARRSGFANLTADIDFRPTDWFTLYFDSSYDTREGRLDTANFDIYINGGPKWSWAIGKRYNRAVDDQITTQFKYIINPKWAFSLLERFDVKNGELEEQEYILTRDLHSWEMDIKLNDEQNDGTEILLLFRLKAFPDMGFDIGTTFERKRSGSDI